MIAAPVHTVLVCYVYGISNLYTTTTTQRGRCIEAFLSILCQSQSQSQFQEVVVYRISLPKDLTNISVPGMFIAYQDALVTLPGMLIVYQDALVTLPGMFVVCRILTTTSERQILY